MIHGPVRPARRRYAAAALLCAGVALLLSSCEHRQSAPAFTYAVPSEARQPPEGGSGWTDKPGWSAARFMVAAANPLAADAGYQVLEAGGSAVDAAIAVQMVLTLVEPQSSGIGGGAFLVYWDGSSPTVLDGRETAPAAATHTLFLDERGQPLPLARAIVGGRSVGVPGVLRMLEMAHQRYGALPWRSLFEPAITLAEGGFAISPRLASLIHRDAFLPLEPVARAYFYTSAGVPKPAGTLLRNPELAAVLRAIADRGVDALYTGALATAIVHTVRSHPTNPGVLTESDLSAYRVVERTPLCFPYRRVRICGVPPPGSGTVALAQILGMLEQVDMSALPPERLDAGQWRLDPRAVHAYTEAARLAFADRDVYVADPDFVDVPVPGLIDQAYLRTRAALIGPRSMIAAAPGRPPGAARYGADATPDVPSTSHISVVDAEGHAVAMTTTIEDAFGSRQMVHGFLLNNQLTDFSLNPRDADGRLVANRVQGGKRPRSSMAPVLVFDAASGQLLMTLGSPGGSAIINYVGKVLVGTIDWGLTIQDAIALPNFGSRNGPTELEANRVDADTVAALERMGHAIRLMEQTSGVQGIERTPSGWFGGADPRREGIARGR